MSIQYVVSLRFVNETQIAIGVKFDT